MISTETLNQYALANTSIQREDIQRMDRNELNFLLRVFTKWFYACAGYKHKSEELDEETRYYGTKVNEIQEELTGRAG